MDPIIVLFTHNLRLEDNAPLYEAAQQAPVIPVYVHTGARTGIPDTGSASKWWLHHSLTSLARRLDGQNSRLIIRKGNPYTELKALLSETGAKNIYFEQSLLPGASKIEDRLYKLCRRSGGEARRFRGQTLFHPSQIHTNEGRPYRVFTQFWNKCRAIEAVPTPLPVPTLSWPERWPNSLTVDQLDLMPRAQDWSKNLHAHWSPGEDQAQQRLDAFLSDHATRYSDTGDDLSNSIGTSKLSPHLHFGEISPIMIWHRMLRNSEQFPEHDNGRKAFLRQIGWREFSYHLLYHFPQLVDAPLNDTFADFPWVKDPRGLEAWKRGQTGHPIVDAGMRQLMQTGWIHSRVRMIVASFLVKDLLIDWREGAKWFWERLVDADLASNTANWQWVAGCGADAAPYFRIFNPTLQGKKFDPDGTYVRRYVPEIAHLPNPYIHEPWRADDALMPHPESGISYPAPIIDHAIGRERALAAYQASKH